MKKLKLFFVAMLLSAVAINSFGQAVNTTITYDGITYTFTSVAENNRTVRVTKVDATVAGDVVTIPAIIKDSEGNFDYKVTSINCAFGSNAIGRLVLSENMEKIEILSGTAIEEIYLPSTVTTINSGQKGYGLHPCTGLKNIFVSDDNQKLYDIDGVLFAGTSLKQYPQGRTDTNYTVPDGITTITEIGALCNSKLTSLNFGNSVSKVEGIAIECSNVTDVTIPASLTDISSLSGLSGLINYNVVSEHSVYSDIDGVLCNKDKTELVGYPRGRTNEDYSIPSSIVTIKSSVFANSKLNSLSFAEATNLKYIEKSAFLNVQIKDNDNRQTLDLSNTKVERIEDEAFRNFASGAGSTYHLTTVKLPETIKYIGTSAFLFDYIESINFPEGLEYIGYTAFQHARLTTLHIPSTLTYFSSAAFHEDYLLTAVTVAEGNPVYAAENGVVYSKNFEELVFYPRGKADESYTINAKTVKALGHAMAKCKFKTIIIPETLETISNYTFSNCPNLSSVVWPENSNLKTIGQFAFEHCYELSTFDLPVSVEKIDINAFRDNKFEEFKIPDNSKLNILNMNSWSSNPYLKTFTIGKNTSISQINGAYQIYNGPANLETFVIEEGNTNLKVFATDLFKGNVALKTVSIAADCGQQTTGVELWSSCFADLTTLESLTLPAAVTSIGTKCFYNTPNLTSIVFGDTQEYPCRLATIGDNCFWKCGITSFTVPSSVKTISRQAFHECEALETVYIPEITNSVDKQAFYLCDKLTAINVDKANQTYASSDGIFCNKMKEELIIYPAGKATGSFQLLPPSLKSIGSMSFFWSKSLEKVMIPKKVESIGISAFFGCDNLTDIVLLGDAPIEGVADVENAFPADIATKAKLWVRYGTKAAYQADPFWGQFSNIEETKMGEAADGDENHNYEFFPMAEGSANVLSVKNNKLDYTIVMPETVSDGTNVYKVDYLGDYMLEDAQENVKEVVVKHTPKYIGANAFANADAFLCDGVDDMSTIRFEYDKATFKGKYNEGTNLYMKKSVAEACLEDEKWADLTDVIQWQVPLPAIKTDYGTFSREFAIDLDAINPDKAKPNVIAFTAGEPQYDAKKNLTTVRMISINHTGDNPEGSSGDGDGTFIPANTGVLLKAYNGSSTDFTKATTDETGATTEASGDYYQIAETQTESYGGANLMASVTEHSRTIQPTENGYTNFYVAQGKFWSFTAPRTSTVHKSYLQLSSDVYPAGAKLAIVFVEPDSSESTTGIESINANVDDSDNLYNLQGQRVSKSAKGFYIKNGKKYIKN